MSESQQLRQLREICLALPEATERITWDSFTFRVREKIFAMANQDPAHTDTWLKAGPGVQKVLVEADAMRFFKPPYVGPKGWIGIHLHEPVDWDEVGDLVEESYRLVAPKRLVAQLPATTTEHPD